MHFGTYLKVWEPLECKGEKILFEFKHLFFCFPPVLPNRSDTLCWENRVDVKARRAGLRQTMWAKPEHSHLLWEAGQDWSRHSSPPVSFWPHLALVDILVGIACKSLFCFLFFTQSVNVSGHYVNPHKRKCQNTAERSWTGNQAKAWFLVRSLQAQPKAVILWETYFHLSSVSKTVFSH